MPAIPPQCTPVYVQCEEFLFFSFDSIKFILNIGFVRSLKMTIFLWRNTAAHMSGKFQLFRKPFVWVVLLLNECIIYKVPTGIFCILAKICVSFFSQSLVFKVYVVFFFSKSHVYLISQNMAPRRGFLN
jgi:hypothetical protein